MKHITETFEITFSGEDNNIRVLADNNSKHIISTGIGSTHVTTDDIREFGKYLLDIAAKLDNDPDFNETKSKKSS